MAQNAVVSFLNWLSPEAYHSTTVGRRRIEPAAAGNVGTYSSIENVADYLPVEALEFESSDFRHTWLRLAATDAAVPLPWRVMGLFGLAELIPGQSQYRFVAGAISANPTFERLFPTGTVTNTNWTVSDASTAHGVTDDDPWAASADYVRETTPSSASVLNLSFATPGVTPVTGAKKQAFVLRVGPHVSSGTAKDYTVSLYESGSLVAALGTIDGQAIIDLGKECVIAFYWNASSLGTASGANVEVRIDGPSGGGYDASIRVYSAAWIVDETTFSGSPLDTGWLTVPAWHIEPSTGVNLAGYGLPPLRKLTYTGSTARSSDTGWLFMLRQAWDGAEDFDRELASNSSSSGEWGGVETDPRIGVAWVGPGWSPSRRNMARSGPLFKIADAGGGKVERTSGGQPFGSASTLFRALAAKFDGLTSDEATGLHEVLLRRGELSPYVIVAEPDETDVLRQQAGTVYGLISDVGRPLEFGKGYERFSLSFEFEEIL